MSESDEAAAIRAEYLQRPGLFGLLIKNALLGLLTLGLYRFWAKTALRRYFWGNVSVAGEPFEYTGQGRELFLGFLVVMAIFLPITLAYGGLQVALLAADASVTPLDALYFILLSLLVAAAGFRARRYRLSRTLWRGIRAGQDGSAWAYLRRYALWLVAFMLTLGWSTPWAAADLARYRMAHTFWGDLRGRFEGQPKQLLRLWALAFLLGIVPWLGLGLIYLAGSLPIEFDADGDWHLGDDLGFVPALLMVVGGFGLPLGYLIFTIGWLRWYLSGMRFGGIAITASFRKRMIIGQALLGWFCLLLMVGAAGVAAGLVVGIGGNMLGERGPFLLGMAAVVFGLLGYFILRVSYVFLLHVPILHRIVESISITGLDLADAANQAPDLREQTGEGLADSFEVGIG
jgi:hypothetical protein